MEWSKLDSLVDKYNKVGDIRTHHGIDRIFQLAPQGMDVCIKCIFSHLCNQYSVELQVCNRRMLIL